jgi:inner membrane protein
MDPVTHFLTGACLGRAGLNRTTAYATLAATLAAEAPDIDVTWGWAGPVTGFAHHRGITHTLVGAPVMALAVTALVWGYHRVLASRRRTPTAQPVRWGWVYGAALLADFSHLLLDWTNNYGIRPFFPWNPHWYSLDLVFIIEPLMLLVLGGALLIPSVFGLVDRELERRRRPFRGQGLALAALVAVVALWSVRFLAHSHAMALAAQPGALPTREPLLRVAAEPYAFNPFRWHVIAETPSGYLAAEADGDRLTPDDAPTPKAPVTPAVAAAKASRLGQVYENWSTWPLTEDLGLYPIPGHDVPPPGNGFHTVRFSDMRFRYGILSSSSSAPLAGWVYVGPSGSVEAQAMNGKLQP